MSSRRKNIDAMGQNIKRALGARQVWVSSTNFNARDVKLSFIATVLVDKHPYLVTIVNHNKAWTIIGPFNSHHRGPDLASVLNQYRNLHMVMEVVDAVK